jgi:hypothetical protein
MMCDEHERPRLFKQFIHAVCDAVHSNPARGKVDCVYLETVSLSRDTGEVKHVEDGHPRSQFESGGWLPGYPVKRESSHDVSSITNSKIQS